MREVDRPSHTDPDCIEDSGERADFAAYPRLPVCLPVRGTQGPRRGRGAARPGGRVLDFPGPAGSWAAVEFKGRRPRCGSPSRGGLAAVRAGVSGPFPLEGGRVRVGGGDVPGKIAAVRTHGHAACGQPLTQCRLRPPHPHPRPFPPPGGREARCRPNP